MLPVIGALRPWADPEQIAIGRLPMHTTMTVDADRRLSLDGDWAFELFATPDAVPARAVTGPTPGARTAAGRPVRRVAVPGNWTMQDVGDAPHYTNVQMPFPGPPPNLPARNPTGVYRRAFRVPAAWRGDQVVLHIGGAESVHAVYCNDAFVGYGTDSRLPSDYDLSPHLRRGTNHLAIVVLRYSAQSYVEDQDQWWMAGLHRSVSLEARPPVHLADLRADATLDGDRRGVLALTVEVGSTPDRRTSLGEGWRVRARLTDHRGRRAGPERVGDVPHVFARPYVFTGHQVTVRWEVPRVAPWSAEHPDRYRVDVELVAPDGTVAHSAHLHIGFRRVEVRDRQLLVNGQPIKVHGVNRHDHHPDRGKAVTLDDLRADLVQMRRHNITAVRTAHYPNDPAFYDLCDELGMYVVDEANIEAHAYNTSLCRDPRWLATWMARGTRMVQRDRNHPSIILWSLGNESGYGPHHDALAGWIRSSDPGRPLHYEGAIFHTDWVHGGRTATDIVCPMYAPIEAIAHYGASGQGDRPLILCEYSHAMGNSNGTLADYWDAIDNIPGLQGGFIWEWKDHGLRQRLARPSATGATERLAYGGQFGDEPNDGNFVADGLVSADLEPHPALHEVAWVYRPVAVQRSGRAGMLRVHNRQAFTGVDAYRATWTLLIDGRPARRGVWRLPTCPPLGHVDVPVPCALPSAHEHPGSEVHLTVEFALRHGTWFAAAGHVVARDQIELRRATAPRAAEVRRHLAALGGSTAATPPAPTTPVECLLRTPVTLQLFRAPIDNDGFKLLPDLSRRIGVGGRTLVRWTDAGLDTTPAEQLVRHRHTRTVEPDGAVVHHHRVDIPDELDDLPRLGVSFSLPGSFGRLRWFGRGPHENYPDRNRSALLGIWEGRPDELPYLVPQEFGLRTDCRWFACTDRRGRTVRIDALLPHALHISATHARPADLYAAATATDFVPCDDLVVQIDLAHRGVGTASCGPDTLAPYRLAPGRYEFAYRLRLV